MALIFQLKSIEHVTGKADRYVTIEFRDYVQKSKIYRNIRNNGYFGESFEWPVARAIEGTEVITVKLYNHNKYLSNKLVATYTIWLQEVAKTGHISLRDHMLNKNNEALRTMINYELKYYNPDGSIGDWNMDQFTYPVLDTWQDDDELDSVDNQSVQMSLLDSVNDSVDDENAMITEPLIPKRRNDITDVNSVQVRDFQVSVNIVEGQQLVGMDIDPVVKVRVGNKLKMTSIKKSTNNPYYNEYFVFDFHAAPSFVFDQVISLTVMHSYNLPGREYTKAVNMVAGNVIGAFKIDAGMVYSATDHMFYHKWAALIDPKDINGGIKGYLKVDIQVVGKGDKIKVPTKPDVDEDNIEANLLIPKGTTADRQTASFSVRIHKAEDLPKMDSGIVANLKKSMTIIGPKAYIDPFVRVSFAGNSGRTSIVKSYDPEFNQQLVFTDMFPPLCNRMRIDLCDSDAMMDDTIATHFLDLEKMSNDGNDGFLPTFGPSWIYMYGNTRKYSAVSALDKVTNSEAAGMGSTYRGRILLSVKTEIMDSTISGPSQCSKSAALPISENAPGPKEDFFLFGSLLEATMIKKEIGKKAQDPKFPIYFEFSMGIVGNDLDKKPSNDIFDLPLGDDDDDEEGRQKIIKKDSLPHDSTTKPGKPLTEDGNYYHMPYSGDKPCVYLRGLYEDNRKRLYNTNAIEKIYKKMDEGLEELTMMLALEKKYPERRLRGIVAELILSCERYVSQFKGQEAQGRTSLDKERFRMCIGRIDKAKRELTKINKKITSENVKQKIRDLRAMAKKLKFLADEPQHVLPDVFIWMIQNGKRIAFQRIPAKELIYSVNEDERGRLCGKVQTLFLRDGKFDQLTQRVLPGVLTTVPNGWAIQAKLQVYFWLGVYKNKRTYLDGLPKGYTSTPEIKNAQTLPPTVIQYKSKQVFQLRAYIYRARGLIGSDDTGLSDPFARVIMGNGCKKTQAKRETLNPLWEEAIIVDDIEIFRPADDIVEDPPTVMVEIYDWDHVGDPEFIGRTIAVPAVKLASVAYTEPDWPAKLQWLEVTRGEIFGGQILASFELLQGSKHLPLPEVLNQAEIEKAALKKVVIEPIYSIPPSILPNLVSYRIETLFWGVRLMRRVQLLSVSSPRVDIECNGVRLKSTIIPNASKHPNFTVDYLQYVDVDLPENLSYWPPIVIHCVDCRNFGREVLVGTATVPHPQKFMHKEVKAITEVTTDTGGTPPGGPAPPPGSVHGSRPGTPLTNGRPANGQLPSNGHQLGKQSKDDKGSVRSLLFGGKSNKGSHAGSVKGDTKPADVAITIEETSPDVGFKPDAKPSDPNAGGIDNMGFESPDEEPLEEEEQDGRKPSKEEMEILDWWSRYHASLNDYEKALQRQLAKRKKEDPEEKDDDDDDPTDADSEEEMMIVKKKKEPAKVRFKKAGKKLISFAGNKIKSKMNNDEKEDLPDQNVTFLKDENEDNSYISRIKIYNEELEGLSEFSNFTEILHTFPLYRGKVVGDEDIDDDSKLAGKFKGSFCIYPKPENEEITTLDSVEPQKALKKSKKAKKHKGPVLKLMKHLPSIEPVAVAVRVYIVKALDLHPSDPNGKADPYLEVSLGKQTVNTKDNYKPRALNPVFGQVFEFDAMFPADSILTVRIMDWDLLTFSDLIGETTIDLEDRYISKHRGGCGIAKQYEIFGYNNWRDPEKPTNIVHNLCKKYKINQPVYNVDKVTIEGQTYSAPAEIEDEHGEAKGTNEHLALEVLHHWEEIPKAGWKLVPEHLETRALHRPDKPGVEQGRLQMWVDMFPKHLPPPPAPTDITPREPKGYELRAIIWNTEDVVLDDSNILTGEKSSDILVKGFFKGNDIDLQETDVHYRSMSGEGNFNWRFIYKFDYLEAEKKVSYKIKESPLALDETEVILPPRLTLQIWDADLVMSNDFLGAVTLDLNKMPLGAKNAKNCKLKMMNSDGSVPPMSLFKNKKVRGFWPVMAKDKSTGEDLLQGKIDLELHLLTEEEAQNSPAGVAREEPDPLPKPNRPDTSFLWFMNPCKTLRYVIWENFKWKILKAFLFLLLVAFMALFIYNAPGYTVKKLFGA
ncbi:unnamed protein product [Owenia fusiformis]|uniref:C2 domain-containing protein n=1 Tax=Owenia fusiformis TaxID=6347 RepID=A0A8S4N2P5_OWEFU|nr:unnamed protein product [Owenia fusiformis]